MKNFSWRAPSWAMVAIAAIAIWSCMDNNLVSPDVDQSAALSDGGTVSTPVTTTLLVTPYIIAGANEGGNRTCEEVTTAINTGEPEENLFPGFENSGDKKDYNDNGFPGNTTTYGPITVTVVDGTYINWTSSVPVIAAFIVKGSNQANIYYYSTCSSGDTGLASPEAGQSGSAAGLSNLTVCWTVCEQDECFDDETAWAASSAGTNKYTNKGNWATWVNGAGSYSLFAGQTMNAGSVNVAIAGGTVTVTINLTGDWMFDPETNESLKIQDYNKAPSGNPSPGLFMHKFDAEGTSYTATFPYRAGFNWFGIHADLVKKVACPE